MDRRRLLVLVTAVGVGAVLVVLGRPGGGDSEPSGSPAQPGHSAGPAPADRAAFPTGTGAPAPAGTGPAGATPVPTIEDGGVAGPEVLDPAQLPDALAAAERFAAVWAAPDPGWHARLAALATPALAGSLAGADPPQPARELTGAGRVYFDAPQWARIGVPAVRGTVVLDVVAVDGRWLVSAVDWWPA